MMIIRPIEPHDLDSFEKVAEATGLGMTSIPKDRPSLEHIIEHSKQSFSKDITAPANELYFFVLEDRVTKEIGGVCGIYSKTGVSEPVYFYYLELQSIPPSSLPVKQEQLLLHPFSMVDGPSELCSLYLLKDFRKEGLGKLLSFSRMLFIANFKERFDSILYAELRGFLDKNKHSPFWNGLGRHFLNLSFEELNQLLNGRRNCLPESLPKYPIYANLLPSSAEKAIQKTHIHTKNALKMLSQEGFSLADRINAIDGGPIVEAQIDEIKVIKNSKIGTVKEIATQDFPSKLFLTCNQSLQFRCCYAKLKIHRDGSVTIPKEIAEALMIEKGHTLRYLPANGR